jgi:hypothetical protein
MAYDGMDNAMTNQANKQTGVLRRFGLTGAIIVAACLATGATFLGYGVDANLPWPVTSNTTIAAKYCGGTVQAGTGSTGFFTVTVPGVSGFPSNCVVNITNGDTTTLRGKGIAGLSGSGCSTRNILWPGQTCKIGIVNGAWAVLSRPGRWRPPATLGPLTNFYTDYANGTDVLGATDGLAPGASAFKSVAQCLLIWDDQLDFDALGQTQAACNMAPATVDQKAIHFAIHSMVGAQGAAPVQVLGASLSITGAVSNGGLCEITVSSTATYSTNELVSVYGVSGATGCNGAWAVTVTDGTHLTLQGTAFGGSYTSGGTVTNGSVLNVINDVAFQCYFGAIVQIQNVYIESSIVDINPTAKCYVTLQAGNILGGNPNSALIQVDNDATGFLAADIGIASGAGNSAVQVFSAGRFTGTGGNINFVPGVNPSFSGFAFAYADTMGQADFSPIVINLNGNAVTGSRCQANIAGFIRSRGGVANTYFPGSSNCTQSGGGNIDGVVIPPNPSASTLGGIESTAAIAHQWIDSISTGGAPHQSQPATADLSDVTAPTAWTATDGSGAGLTFATNADTRYVKNGKICVVSFMIQWPATSDTHTAQVNGIPSACAAYSGAFNWVPGGAALTGVSSIGGGIAWVTLQAGGTSLFFFGNANPLTNANMSNGIVRGTITYITN